MGSREAPGLEGANAGPFADTRACLRPDRCPYALGTASPGLTAAPPAVWREALLDLLPGDPALARELAEALAELAGVTG